MRGTRLVVRWVTPWPADELVHLLTPAEQARLERLRQAGDRDRFATGRALARVVVGEWLGAAARDVTLVSRCPTCGGTDHGVPSVVPAGVSVTAPRPVPWVSVTHAGAVVAVAVTDAGPVGIDTEPVTGAVFAGFDDVALAGSEARALRGGAGAGTGTRADADADADADDGLVPADARLRLWVRKEAVLKAIGRGLTTDPRDVLVSGWAEPGRVLRLPGEPDPGAWRLWEPELRPGYVTTVAVRPTGDRPVTTDVRELDGAAPA
ncbi:4'-phosphopantetheinyl transferase superfamily protein [Cellulomonas hominis]